MIIPIIRGGRGLKNDDKYHNFYRGDQKVMIGIVISENDDNCGPPLTRDGSSILNLLRRVFHSRIKIKCVMKM